MSTEKAKVELKQDKHEALAQAIGNVDSVLDRSHRLYERIMRMPQEDRPCIANPDISLHQLLVDSPDALYGTIEEIRMMLQKIEDAIF